MGSLDPDFGTKGEVKFTIGTGESGIMKIGLTKEGKIITTGHGEMDGQWKIIVSRHHVNGTPDGTFGENGIVTTALSATESRAFGLSLQEDGKAVIGGYIQNGARNDFALVRYLTDGKLDPAFGKAYKPGPQTPMTLK